MATGAKGANWSASISRQSACHKEIESPQKEHTGLPPNVLKYSTEPEVSATSRVVTTAESGMPLPNGLPSVTMSGTVPWRSNAQNECPTRPNPVCTCKA